MRAQRQHRVLLIGGLPIAILVLTFVQALHAQALDVVPGLNGFGTSTRAAYGPANPPVICVVNTLGTERDGLDDETRNGVPVKVGTLRECLWHVPPADTGIVVLFEVGGTIHAESAPYAYRVQVPYTSILGQSAPSPGVTLRNIVLTVKTHDVLVQHLRIRVGDAAAGHTPSSRDSLSILASAGLEVYNVVADHLSLSWSIDENAQVYQMDGGVVHDVTIANSLFTEPLHDSLHPDGPHAKNFMVGYYTDPPSQGPQRLALYRNFFSNGYDRNPLLADALDVHLANNLSYNNQDLGAVAYPSRGVVRYGIESNVQLAGPASRTKRTRFFDLFWLFDGGSGSRIFFDGNRSGDNVDGAVAWHVVQAGPDDWAGVRNAQGYDFDQCKTLINPVPHTGAEVLPSIGVQDLLVASVGARPNNRDSVDERAINQLLTGTGGLVDCVINCDGQDRQVADKGYPSLTPSRRNLGTEMPVHVGAIPSDPHGYADADGFANLERWLHCLAADVEGRDCASSSDAGVAADAGADAQSDSGDAGAQSDSRQDAHAHQDSRPKTGPTELGGNCGITTAFPSGALAWMGILLAVVFTSRRRARRASAEARR